MNEAQQKLARVVRDTPAGCRAWIRETIRVVDQGTSSAAVQVFFDAGYLGPGEAPPDGAVLLGPVNDGQLDSATDQELFDTLQPKPQS